MKRSQITGKCYFPIDTSTGIDADASKGKTRPGLFWQPVGLMI